MGFPCDHTRHAWPSSRIKDDKQGFEDKRCSLVGNSFNCLVVALLLGYYGHAAGWLPAPVDPQHLVNRVGVQHELSLHPSETCLPPRRTSVRDARRWDSTCSEPAGNERAKVEYQLARLMAEGVDHKGSDVRLDAGELYDPSTWPRRSVKVSRWKWRVVLSLEWKEEEHINVQELRMFYLSAQWRLRSAAQVGTRWVHFMDSQVAIAVATKGRSSSKRLNSLLLRANAVLLAAHCYPLHAYVDTSSNPADAPSRRTRVHKQVNKAKWRKRN
jgi:hypothetical protein